MKWAGQRNASVRRSIITKDGGYIRSQQDDVLSQLAILPEWRARKSSTSLDNEVVVKRETTEKKEEKRCPSSTRNAMGAKRSPLTHHTRKVVARSSSLVLTGHSNHATAANSEEGVVDCRVALGLAILRRDRHMEKISSLVYTGYLDKAMSHLAKWCGRATFRAGQSVPRSTFDRDSPTRIVDIERLDPT